VTLTSDNQAALVRGKGNPSRGGQTEGLRTVAKTDPKTAVIRVTRGCQSSKGPLHPDPENPKKSIHKLSRAEAMDIVGAGRAVFVSGGPAGHNEGESPAPAERPAGGPSPKRGG